MALPTIFCVERPACLLLLRPQTVRRLEHNPTSAYFPETAAITENLRHYNYDIKLNKLQKRALRFTWHRLHTRNGGKRVENVFEEVMKVWCSRASIYVIEGLHKIGTALAFYLLFRSTTV